MSKAQNLQIRKILAVVQTPVELKWLNGQIELRENVEYDVLLLGDAITEHYLSNNVGAKNLNFLFLHDLDIDNEEIWRQYYVVKDELIDDTGPEIDEQLHTVNQINFEMGFSDMLYLQAAIEAVLNRVEPDEIIVPPVSVWRIESTFYTGNLQSVFFEAARRRQIKCRTSLLSRSYFLANPIVAILRQFSLSGFLMFWDAKRRLKHLVSRPAQLKDWQDAILIVNAAHDLPRQFNLPAFAAGNEQKCLVWNWQTGDIKTLENFLAGNEAGKLNDEEIARQTSSVSATNSIKKYFAKTYCSPLRGRSGNKLVNISALMKSRGLSDEKVLNWRRIIYSARLTAKSRDVLKALKPKLVIASEYTDTSRATSIAARSCGIRVLATAHGINMYTEAMQGTVALGDVHCFFGANDGHLVEFALPETKIVRLVAHDNLNKIEKSEHNGTNKGKRRVFIVTSMLSCSFPNWTNEIFVKWIDYGKMLRSLLMELSAHSEMIEVVIKSHPLLDDHKMYDQLQSDFPELLVRHWREPIDMSEPIPADIIVLYNCVSTLAFAAMKQDLPILAFWGALTPLAHRNLVLNQLSGTDDVSRLVEIILEIARSADGETAEKARRQAKQLLSRFVEPTNLGLAEAVELTLKMKNAN